MSLEYVPPFAFLNIAPSRLAKVCRRLESNGRTVQHKRHTLSGHRKHHSHQDYLMENHEQIAEHLRKGQRMIPKIC